MRTRIEGGACLIVRTRRRSLATVWIGAKGGPCVPRWTLADRARRVALLVEGRSRAALCIAAWAVPNVRR
eukprot:5148787-Pyramimonas_sp.AAC.1